MPQFTEDEFIFRIAQITNCNNLEDALVQQFSIADIYLAFQKTFYNASDVYFRYKIEADEIIDEECLESVDLRFSDFFLHLANKQ